MAGRKTQASPANGQEPRGLGSLRGLHIFLAVAGAATAIGALASLAGVVRSSSVWPTEGFAECAGEVACVLGVSLSQAWPLWLGGFWVLSLVLVVVVSALMPGSQGSSACIQKSLEGQRTEQGQRIGHVAGWALFISSFVFMLTLVLVLVLVPLGAGVVAVATWSKNRISQCSDARLCVVSAIPENVLPVWIAFAWIVVIAAALAVCWHPSRWWMPDAQPRRGLTVRVDTSPLWIGGYAVVAAFICAALSLGVHQRGNDVYAPEYLWAALATATVAVGANYRHRKLVGTVPWHIKESFFFTVSSPAAAFSPEWRAKQRELHPRKKDGPNDG